MADQVWLAGFWLNSGLQGEARANGKLDTSSLALHYLHGLPRPVYWVLWLWRRLRGEILVHDKNLLLLHHQGSLPAAAAQYGGLQSLALQRSGLYPALQPALQRAAAGLDGSAGIKRCTCSISTTARYSRWWTPFAAAAALTPRIISG